MNRVPQSLPIVAPWAQTKTDSGFSSQNGTVQKDSHVTHTMASSPFLLFLLPLFFLLKDGPKAGSRCRLQRALLGPSVFTYMLALNSPLTRMSL